MYRKNKNPSEFLFFRYIKIYLGRAPESGAAHEDAYVGIGGPELAGDYR